MVADDVLGAVRDALPAIRDAAEQCERERAVSNEIFKLVEDTGVVRMFVPKRYGGLEGDLQTFLDAVAAIGGACASTGWVAGVLGTHQWVAANFPERAQDDAWGEEPNSSFALTATPGKATAVAVDGGYRLNGTFHFCSGGNHANWHLHGANIVDPKTETKVPAMFMLPAADMTFVDNWFVNGLRGTASCDWTAADVFVPEHRVLLQRDLLACETPGQRVNPAPLYRVPNATIVVLGIAAPVIGATEAALATFINDTRTRERTGGLMGATRKMWESQTLQRRTAGACAQLDAVRTLIARDLLETQEAVRAGQLSVELRVRNRRDFAYAVRSCVDVMAMIYESSSSSVMFPPNPLERAWRDVNAGAKHVGLNWDNMGTAAGRLLFGLEPGATY